MQRLAFKMKLHEGQMAEYKKRHDELWFDLQDMLKSVGVCEYSIFLDEETYILFAFLKTDDPTALDDLPNQEVAPLAHPTWHGSRPRSSRGRSSTRACRSIHRSMCRCTPLTA